MVQLFKRIFLSAVVVLGAERAQAFSLLGPVNEAYQVPVIAHDLPTDIGAVKNLGEEYRWNRPVVYYAANQNFLDYFGASGLAAVDSAFAVMNSLTNVSLYSPNLVTEPMEALRENYLAQALGLLDLKSQTLEFIIEQMGLAEPERFTWTLHNRFTTPGGQCPPNQVYDVIKRNFEPFFTNPDVLMPSSYVNGTLYSYTIFERCTGANPLADAIEFAVDPSAKTFTAVASKAASFGGFYNGLTRDDIGGLRYLLRTNNYNFEATGSETFAFVTNNTIQLLFTSNLTELVSAALTNNAAALSTLFPDLQIVSTLPIFTNVVTTNFISYFTNHPADPAGTVRRVDATVVETNVTTWFKHQFANVFLTPTIQLAGNFSVPVVPGHASTSNLVQVLTTNISLSACPPGSPYTGVPCTNISISTPVWTNGVFGDYFILPTNLCSVALVSTQLIRQLSFTNTIVTTNAAGTTNAANEQFSRSTVFSFNQYIYQVRPVVCPTNSVAHRQGVERIQFVRRDFDSLIGRFFHPITNDYPMVILTNNTLVMQTVRRVVTTPDLLFNAADLAPGPSVIAGVPPFARSISFDQANASPGLAGPGVIQPGSVATFNKVGPIYENFAPDFLDEATSSLWFIWGSFDGTTNAPIVYPNGADIINLENQVLIHINPSGPTLPNATVGVNYAGAFAGFTVSGAATAPYYWSLAPASAGLPPGLNLNPSTGQVVGSPTTQGVYDFALRMTDSVGRFVDRNYTITVLP